MKIPKILVFASGGKGPGEGGSGFETMVQNTRLEPKILDAKIVAVVSNHKSGGVFTKAQRTHTPFEYFSGPYTAENYQKIIEQYNPDYVMLSGWLKMVRGLDPKTTINIHPGPLPNFGGSGLYGHFVHEAVLNAYHMHKITQSAVTMHFVTEEYDMGPIIFSHPVYIDNDDTSETLGKRVNEVERVFQSIILNKIVHGEISYEQRYKL